MAYLQIMHMHFRVCVCKENSLGSGKKKQKKPLCLSGKNVWFAASHAHNVHAIASCEFSSFALKSHQNAENVHLFFVKSPKQEPRLHSVQEATKMMKITDFLEHSFLAMRLKILAKPLNFLCPWGGGWRRFHSRTQENAIEVLWEVHGWGIKLGTLLVSQKRIQLGTKLFFTARRRTMVERSLYNGVTHEKFALRLKRK